MNLNHPPRAALVTGATSGIGEAFARALPPETALLLSGRDEDKLDRLRVELGGARRIDVVAADLATAAGLDALASAAHLFEPDLLIANAGIGPYCDILETDEADLRDLVSVNVVAPLLLARRLLPDMIATARSGRRRCGFIAVSSTAAFLPMPKLAAYAASKSFLLSWTEALAAELWRDPIDILALCPTATRSDFARRSGFGAGIPGAQDPAHVASKALTALGRRRTLVMGPVSSAVFTGPVLLRAAAAQMFRTVLPRR